MYPVAEATIKPASALVLLGTLGVGVGRTVIFLRSYLGSLDGKFIRHKEDL